MSPPPPFIRRRLASACECVLQPLKRFLKPDFVASSFEDFVVTQRELLVKRGIRHILVDKDACITLPKSDELHASAQPAVAALLADERFTSVALLSNSLGSVLFGDRSTNPKSQRQPMKAFGLPVVNHIAPKPLCGWAVWRHVLQQENSPLQSPLFARHVAIVGDRLLTDVLLGKFFGFCTVFVAQPLLGESVKEGRFISALRRIENALLR